MTRDEFVAIYNECSLEVADEFYPKGESPRRGEYLRDQALLCFKLTHALEARGVFSRDKNKDCLWCTDPENHRAENCTCIYPCSKLFCGYDPMKKIGESSHS